MSGEYNLVMFLTGERTDDAGRMIQDIWNYTYDELEKNHDYIQWIFPINTVSSANPAAPTINNSILFDKHLPKIQENLRTSFKLMLNFYGYEYVKDNGNLCIVESANFKERTKNWISLFNHNYRRITRILKSLYIFGLHEESNLFIEKLELLSKNHISMWIPYHKYWKVANSQKRR